MHCFSLPSALTGHLWSHCVLFSLCVCSFLPPPSCPSPWPGLPSPSFFSLLLPFPFPVSWHPSSLPVPVPVSLLVTPPDGEAAAPCCRLRAVVPGADGGAGDWPCSGLPSLLPPASACQSFPSAAGNPPHPPVLHPPRLALPLHWPHRVIGGGVGWGQPSRAVKFSPLAATGGPAS